MRVTALRVRDFRSYERAAIPLGDGLTVIAGENGAGKTNLLEALHFGCTGRSCRTANERELVRWGAPATRVEVEFWGEDRSHEVSVGLMPGQPKQLCLDGVRLEAMNGAVARPLVIVFLPERLELIKGPPALRRGHLDQLVTALWPSRVATRQSYVQALAQRNALISRIRSGAATAASLASWDSQLACYAIELMHDRARATKAVADRCGSLAQEMGLGSGLRVSYRPRSEAADAEQLACELGARARADIERGFTTHGPHRDELAVALDGRELRTYGSQGQQRIGLLSLLLAEREAIQSARGAPPVMLLDDVMSELDGARRLGLLQLLGNGGQSVITTTDLEYVPSAGSEAVLQAVVADGRVSIESDLAGRALKEIQGQPAETVTAPSPA